MEKIIKCQKCKKLFREIDMNFNSDLLDKNFCYTCISQEMDKQ